MSDSLGNPEVSFPDKRIGCQLCVLHCPDFAITVDEKEENGGQLRKEVERLSTCDRGKIHGLNVLDPTFITAEQMVEKVREIRARHRRTGEYVVG